MGPILLVDDNSDFRAMTRMILEGHGYRVVDVAGGEEALDVLLTDHPVSLIITDLYMPGVTGLGLLRRMREMGKNVPPVIVITGTAFLSDNQGRVAAEALGAKIILTKPVDAPELLRAVAQVLTEGQPGTTTENEKKYA